jgi:hypothetical protein
MPLCPERGTINAVADGVPLPRLRVRAAKTKERMEITNMGDFTPDRTNGVTFYINGRDVSEMSSKNKEVSCSSEFKSEFRDIIQTCSFARKGKGKKRRK